MECACKPGVIRSAEGLKGKEIKLAAENPLPLYYATPDSESKVGVVIIHDIFGFKLPNCKYIADHFAAKGLHCVLPDLYQGEEWPADEFKILEGLEGDKFGKFFGKYTALDYVNGKLTKEVELCVDFLRAAGCDKFAVVGFCWGGYITSLLGATGLFQAGVSVHGCIHDGTHVKASKCPLFFITVPNDPYYDDAKVQSCLDAGAKVRVFDGLYHGFVVRGDFANNEAVRNAADEATNDMVAFIKEKTA